MFQLLTTGIFTTLIFVSILALCEIKFPRKLNVFLQKENLQNVGWFFLNNFLLLLGLNLLTHQVSQHISTTFTSYSINILNFHLFIQVIIILILSDAASYMSHRLLHRIDFLWNFHKLHHSSENLNVLSSLRHHWVEIPYHSFFISLFTSWIIVDFQSRSYVAILMTFACYFQHANIKMNFPHWVDFIFITPRNHRWHHSKEMAKFKGMNFGFIFSIWDRLLVSFHLPINEPSRFGIEESYPKSFFKRLIYPLKF